MITLRDSANTNSFAVDDWSAAGVWGGSVFTVAAPVQRAPKKLVTFEWSLDLSVRVDDEATPAEEHRLAIDSMFEHTMTKKEAAYFRGEMASGFVPLTPEQTRLLPPRAE